MRKKKKNLNLFRAAFYKSSRGSRYYIKQLVGDAWQILVVPLVVKTVLFGAFESKAKPILLLPIFSAGKLARVHSKPAVLHSTSCLLIAFLQLTDVA